MANAQAAAQLGTLRDGPQAMRPTALRTLTAIVKSLGSSSSVQLISSPEFGAALLRAFEASVATDEVAAEVHGEAIALLRLCLEDTPPPSVFPSLFEIACAPIKMLCGGTVVPDRLAPVCELLRSLADAIPTPRRADAAMISSALSTAGPALDGLCHTLLDACAAEHRRAEQTFGLVNAPEQNFGPLNALYKLAVRAAACLPHLPGGAGRVPQHLIECMLPPLVEAFRAVGSGTGDVRVAKLALFYGDKLRGFCTAFARYSCDPISKQSAAGDESRGIALALAASYAALSPRPPPAAAGGDDAPGGAPPDAATWRTTWRRLRTVLDACVVVLLEAWCAAPAADVAAATCAHAQGSEGSRIFAQWVSLAEVGSAHTAPAGSRGGGDWQHPHQHQQHQPYDEHTLGLLQLLAAAMRAAVCGASSELLAPSVLSDATSAWLGLLPRCYASLLYMPAATSAPIAAATPLSPPPPPLVSMLADLNAVVERVRDTARPALLRALVGACCSPHFLTRVAAIELASHVLCVLPGASASPFLRNLLLLADRLALPSSPTATSQVADDARRALLSLAAAACSSSPSDDVRGQLLAQLHPVLSQPHVANVASGGGGGGSKPPTLDVAVELLEALAAHCPPPAATLAASASEAATAARERSSLQQALGSCRAASWLSALLAATGRCGTAHACLCLRAIAALVRLLPAVALPADAHQSLPPTLVQALQAASPARGAAASGNPSAAASAADAQLCESALSASAALIAAGTLSARQLGALLHAAAAALPPTPATSHHYHHHQADGRVQLPMCKLVNAALSNASAVADAPLASALSRLILQLVQLAFSKPAVASSLQPIGAGGERNGGEEPPPDVKLLQHETIALAAQFMLVCEDGVQINELSDALSATSPQATRLLHAKLGAPGVSGVLQEDDSQQRAALDGEAARAIAAAAKAQAAVEATVSVQQRQRAAKRAKCDGPAAEAARRGLGLLRSGLQALREAATQAWAADGGAGNGSAFEEYHAELLEHVQQVNALATGAVPMAP